MKTTLLTILFSALFAIGVTAQTTAFTFQGSLKDGASPANGNYDLEFKLFDAVSAGTQQGSTLQRLNVAVANGVFTVSLDFGAGTLPGADRFLDIAVRTSGGGAFTPLSPRQQVNSAPYAVRSLNAATADSVAAGGIPGGSGNYIQNSTSQQATSNFYISGTGRAEMFRAPVINAFGEYQIFGGRVLSAVGDNLSLGGASGSPNGGISNTFLGFGTGMAATSNSAQNTFAGTFAGTNNSNGVRNSFFGARAGISNTFGSNNTFTGEGAGPFNTTGTDNSFFGSDAGQSNSTGSRNSYFGTWAGGLPTVTDSSAFGYRAFATQDNSLILGSVNGFNGATSSPRVGIGTTAPLNRLEVVDDGNAGLRVQTNLDGGTVASFGGKGAFQVDAPGVVGKRFSILENGNVGIGTTSPLNRLEIVDDGNAGLRVQTNLDGGKVASFGDKGVFQVDGPQFPGQRLTILEDGSVGIGIASPLSGNRLHVVGNSTFNGTMGVAGGFSASFISLGLANGGGTQLCRNALNQISACSSSLRYKTNIGQFSQGLSFVNKLRPITFDWKDGGMKDVGFGAEDVANIDPRFVTYNDKGEVEGVKYDRLSVAFVNAFKEQQEQIETLQKTNVQQQQQIEKQQAFIESLEKRLEQLEKKERP